MIFGGSPGGGFGCSGSRSGANGGGKNTVWRLRFTRPLPFSFSSRDASSPRKYRIRGLQSPFGDTP
jgi:hypothetical protein